MHQQFKEPTALVRLEFIDPETGKCHRASEWRQHFRFGDYTRINNQIEEHARYCRDYGVPFPRRIEATITLDD